MDINILGVITVCLALSFLLSQICKRLRLPEIIGQIGAGVILSLPIFAIFLTNQLRYDLEFL